MGYEADIKGDAINFIEEHEGEIKEAITEEKEIDDLDELYEALREEEFYFDLSDAVVVIETSDEVEEDSGLWEGQQPEEAIVTKAVFTAQNDLRNKVKEIYDELKENFENKKEEQSEYIDLDHKTAKLVPHLKGKYRGDVIKYFNKAFKGIAFYEDK